MALEQTEVMVSKEWVSLSQAQCMVQSITHKDTQFDVVLSDAQPVENSSFFRMKFTEPTTFSFGTAVWCRLSDIRRMPGSRVNEITIPLCVARELV